MIILKNIIIVIDLKGVLLMFNVFLSYFGLCDLR